MAKTYDPALGDDVSWVRFLMGDTDGTATPAAELDDDEIQAIIDDETVTHTAARRRFAAATCLGALRSRWQADQKGLMEKKVDDYRIRTDAGETAETAIERRIAELRQQGAELLIGSDTDPAPFAML